MYIGRKEEELLNRQYEGVKYRKINRKQLKKKVMEREEEMND